MSGALISLLINVLNFYMLIIFAMVIMSWLKAFGIANMRNPIVAQIDNALNALTEPVLRPIRNFLPNMGGLDLSPIVLIFGIYFLIDLLGNLARGQIL